MLISAEQRVGLEGYAPGNDAYITARSDVGAKHIGAGHADSSNIELVLLAGGFAGLG